MNVSICIKNIAIAHTYFSTYKAITVVRMFICITRVVHILDSESSQQHVITYVQILASYLYSNVKSSVDWEICIENKHVVQNIILNPRLGIILAQKSHFKLNITHSKINKISLLPITPPPRQTKKNH